MVVSVFALYFVVKFGGIRLTYQEKLAYKISYANMIAAAIVTSIR